MFISFADENFVKNVKEVNYERAIDPFNQKLHLFITLDDGEKQIRGRVKGGADFFRNVTIIKELFCELTVKGIGVIPEGTVEWEEDISKLTDNYSDVSDIRFLFNNRSSLIEGKVTHIEHDEDIAYLYTSNSDYPLGYFNLMSINDETIERWKHKGYVMLDDYKLFHLI
ncbi:MAG: hypothetical protein IJ806_07160 [Ruminococcus sp.]|nr:hypothetical protein [Ruminococcus sp.]MBR1863845.1 hypothetical protein [Ruminococcus sp.]